MSHIKNENTQEFCLLIPNRASASWVDSAFSSSRLCGEGAIPLVTCLWVDAVHSFPFFLGLEDFCTHNTGLPAVRLCCQGLEDVVVLQL